jgi:hypothetical protein
VVDVLDDKVEVEVVETVLDVDVVVEEVDVVVSIVEVGTTTTKSVTPSSLTGSDWFCKQPESNTIARTQPSVLTAPASLRLQ